MKLHNLFQSSRVSQHDLYESNVGLIGQKISLGRVAIEITDETKSSVWDGDFSCVNLYLKSLYGSPKKVKGYFSCSDNLLTDLTGAPEEVTDDFYCSDNELKSLMGAPKIVRGDFICNRNLLVDLIGAPDEIGADLKCINNNLRSLNGAPKKVKSLMCSYNQLTSFEGFPQIIDGNLTCSHNKFTSLKDINKHVKEINGQLNLASNPIKSHVLGLFRIRGLNRVLLDNTKVETIINKYLPEGRAGLPKAQNELIEAGFENYAQI